MRLIVATSIKNLTNGLPFEIIKVVDNTEELEELFSSSEAPCDVLLVSEKNLKTTGSLTALLIKIHNEHPKVKIVYLSSGGLSSKYNINQLCTLADNGIYNLFYKEGITKDGLIELINITMTKEDCAPIYDALDRQNKQEEELLETIPENVSLKNVYTVTSVKPGTGKSFISSNLAITLAKYNKRNLKVLLLEGDLQTLSVATLFGIKNADFNLRTAMNRIDNYLVDHSVDDWYRKADDVKEFINRCCLKTDVNNLYILEGHDFQLDNLSNVNSDTYYYLVDYLSSQFDIVVVDANSSFQHPTTDPLFQLSTLLFFVFTTEYNNLKLNIRYYNELMKLGVGHKVKYVLNKTMLGEKKKQFLAQGGHDDKSIINSINSGLRIDYEIPLMDMAVILNATYKHRPVALDNSFKTLPTRVKFIRLANELTPLGNMDAIMAEVASMAKKTKTRL